MDEFSKRERQRLRKLAGDAYEAELGAHLAELAAAFTRWRSGTILPSELSQLIHEFHQGPSRQVWSMYQSLREPEIVARAIALGYLPESSLEPPLHEKLAPLVTLYRG